MKPHPDPPSRILTRPQVVPAHVNICAAVLWSAAKNKGGSKKKETGQRTGRTAIASLHFRRECAQQLWGALVLTVRGQF